MLPPLQVLSIYPSTIRRRILRHLYQAPMQHCYLFADCKQKFLDALLAAARVELFMPQVPNILSGLNRTALWFPHRCFWGCL